MIKRIINFSFITICSMLIGICGVSAVDLKYSKLNCKYSILECVSENGYVYKSNTDYSINPSCQFIIDQKNDKITLDKYNEGWGSSYVGGDINNREKLKNWDGKNYCPNTIRVSIGHGMFAGSIEWFGYEDIESARKSVKSYDYIFVLDPYLEELKSSTAGFDRTVNYTCEYDTFSIDFNKDGYALSAKSTIDLDPKVGTYHFNLSENMTKTPAINPGTCENVHYCLSSSQFNTYINNTYLIFADEMDYEGNKDYCQKQSLITAEFHSSSGDYGTGCRTYYRDIETLNALWLSCKYNIESCNEYNKTKDRISSYCKSIMEYADYKEGSCLTACLNYKDDIIGIEEMIIPSGKCGFSWNLISWIANIVRWIKYIIPIAVIILGILDFIKAMGSEKDDEMKKAQGRFVKRLIAAALIFIVPFIIEFILNKMGFNSNGCGIIDL